MSDNVLPFTRGGRSMTQLGSLVNLDHAISKGATGNDVRDLQRQLYAWGFSPGSFDGIYGAKTAAAVAELQKILRLPQDGIFGPNTLKAVNDDLAQPRSMLGDREAQNINRPPPPPAAVTAQVPAQLSPSAIVPYTATATTAAPAKEAGSTGSKSWMWWLFGGVALVGIALLVKGSGALGETSAEDFFEHDELLGVPQPRKRARRRAEDDEDDDDAPEDTSGDDDDEDPEDEGEEAEP